MSKRLGLPYKIISITIWLISWGVLIWLISDKESWKIGVGLAAIWFKGLGDCDLQRFHDEKLGTNYSERTL